MVIGLLRRSVGFTEEGLRVLFWISYTFTLFQTIPRPILDRKKEEWRWLYQLFSLEANLIGVWLYAFLLSQGVGFYLAAGGYVLWGYAPFWGVSVLGGAVLGVPLAIAALIGARAEASYAVVGVLGFPLLLFPLLWVCLRSTPVLWQLGLLFTGESLLFFGLLPSVLED